MINIPMINSLGTEAKPVIQAFSQLNKRDVIADQEISDGKNLTSELFPVMTCRPSREVVATIANPNALFSANGKLVYVAGTNFYYDGVVKGQVSASAKSMVDFNGKIIIMPDKKYYDYNTGVFGNIGGGAYPAPGSCPDIDFVAIHMNRLYGVKGNNFYGTALGEYDDWTTFAGDYLDAYAVNIVDPGSFTGIVNYQQHLNLWKPDYTFENYGAYPPYQQQMICEIGCIDGRSVAEVNNRLYWLSRRGIEEYGGGLPRMISENLNESYKAGVGASDGRRYYVSVQLADDSWKLYVYDTWREMWMPEDDLHVIGFTYLNGSMYALDVTGKIHKFNSGTEVVDWEIYTKKFDDGVMGTKCVSGLRIQADLEDGSNMNIYVSVDDDPFVLIKSIVSPKFNNFVASFRGQTGKRYQFKIVVQGKGKIQGFRREFVVGGDV